MTTVVRPAIFNGVHTVQNRRTDEYATYRIRTQKDDALFAPKARIVSLLTGPDNHRSYTAFAFVTDDGIRVWANKRGQDGQKSQWEKHAFLLWEVAVNDGAALSDEYEIMTEGQCLVCNRRLTTPESIRLGIGPTCASRG